MPNDQRLLVQQVVHTVMPVLAGKGPQVQGAALADLVALFLAGHDPAVRDDLMLLHVEKVRELVAWYDTSSEE